MQKHFTSFFTDKKGYAGVDPGLVIGGATNLLDGVHTPGVPPEICHCYGLSQCDVELCT